MEVNDQLVSDHQTEHAIRQMEVQAVNFAYRLTNDFNVRQEYMRKTREAADNLRAAYKNGDISAREAANAANQMRNEIMEFARSNSSDLGRAKAKALKARGLDLDLLVEKYANRRYSKSFTALSEAERGRVYLDIVDSSGRSNPRVNAGVRRLGMASKGLWVLTACLATYNIATAENKTKQAGREAASIGGGFGGGAAGGAVAGIWFGPVGVAVGVVVGGTLGAIMADQIYVEVAGPDGEFARNFIPRFTSVFGVDEEGMAKALHREARYELGKVRSVFRELVDKYSTDADDVARYYIAQIRQTRGIAFRALQQDIGLRNLLIRILDDGWTTADEKRDIEFLQRL
ncbi:MULTISPECIES: hypothetical protein [Marinobacter]|uniref:hypothetical protein n=1 Tax=Marinobacter TaxID=2742 RepID=UPI001D062075|nr:MULTISPECIES: hypothetical protein [Marinobacter]MCG8520429.1 hypothetical protein [Pseudomonadales bacterium]MCK7568229.1 hypothetical protein [Marinobacter xestospongiae]UDL06202.1 hypothetical protein J2887_05435 [Marinobacter sp. CA1]